MFATAMKGTRGGKRLGAGRPKGSSTKVKGAVAPAPRVKQAVPAWVDAVVEVEATSAPAFIADGSKYDDPLAFLMDKMNDDGLDIHTRVRVAIAAVQYKHPKYGDGGKKESIAEAAKKAGAGRFAPAAAPPRPKLVSNSR